MHGRNDFGNLGISVVFCDGRFEAKKLLVVFFPFLVEGEAGEGV